MTTNEQLFADLKKDDIGNHDNRITKAKNGDGAAMNSIGVTYQAYEKYDKAMAWYRLAAVKNNSDAQACIGLLYYHGLGVRKSYLVAMEWSLKAALQNNKIACGSIGFLFENGYGVPVDKYKALEWYTKSGNSSDTIFNLTLKELLLTEQDENKSIEQLVMETEDIIWPGRKLIREKQLREEINVLKQQMKKMEEESRARNNEINSLKEVVQSLQVAIKRK